jgi:hypothetical protein
MALGGRNCGNYAQWIGYGKTFTIVSMTPDRSRYPDVAMMPDLTAARSRLLGKARRPIDAPCLTHPDRPSAAVGFVPVAPPSVASFGAVAPRAGWL